ncbi:MAG: hypothetical protein PUE98_06045 [Galactobacillus timonensis]|uniref:hypothetical protein n=1 Tax=Galactobacillus timonensis TaxID=2041840 RepID=UPI00240A7B50|nr:hypothetical protein [Galactobacillus timonensis]MDD6600005.1 hypothetical protein [Galactobacillus timonensis]
MKTKDLRHLSRADLLELLLESREENAQLKKTIEDQRTEIASLKEQLEDKAIRIQKAGTLAQASLELNHIFEDADAAAQQYLANLKRKMDAMERAYKQKLEDKYHV